MKPVQSLSLAACLVTCTLASAHRHDRDTFVSLDSVKVESKKARKLARLFELVDVLEQGQKEVADKLTETEFEADSRSSRDDNKQRKLRKLRRAKIELEKVEEEVAEEVAQTVLVEDVNKIAEEAAEDIVIEAVLKAKKDYLKTKKVLENVEEVVKRTEEAIANEDVSEVLVGVAKAEE
eukprot:65520_1